MPTFAELSKDIVCHFLHSVILADDRIEFKSESLPAIINHPTRESTAFTSTDTEVKVSEKTIDVKPILDEFMLKGIPCSFLALNESIKPNIYIRNFEKADAIILDWQVNSDGGEFILQILESLIGNDKRNLKVILIYTGFPHLKSIIQKIKEKFNDIAFETEPNHGCSIRYGSTSISVYAKTILSVDSELASRVLSDNQLVDALISDFTNITSGLVSNAALKAISIIRQNTHKLISLFNNNLDPAFLANRCLLTNSSDSEEQLLDIIGSEIKSLFVCNDAVMPISKEVIREYIIEFLPDRETDFLFPIKDGFESIEIPEKIDRESLIKFTEIGIENFFIRFDTPKNDKIRFTQNCHSNLTKQYCHNSIDPLISNISFANLTSTRQKLNSDFLPMLTLGSILKFETKLGEDYWLCIQPKCDSVRVEKNREFLFASLKKNDSKEKFDFAIDDKSGIICFDIDLTIYKAKYFKFKANANKTVKAILKDGNFIFVGETSMEWIGELKNDFAQHISNRFASNLSRVGINHSEWLRRGAGK